MKPGKASGLEGESRRRSWWAPTVGLGKRTDEQALGSKTVCHEGCLRGRDSRCQGPKLEAEGVCARGRLHEEERPSAPR